jgi:uncharacterized protein
MTRAVTVRSLGFAAALACAMISSASAQTPSPAQLAAARDVIETTGVADTMGDTVRVFIDEGKRTFLTTNPGLAKDLDAAGDALLPQLKARQDELMGAIALAYARRFTAEELQQVAAFYRTPVGKKFRETQPIAQREAFESFRDWSEQMSQEVITRLRAEMKKKGHDI